MEDEINHNESISNRSNDFDDSKMGILDKLEILKSYKNSVIVENTMAIIKTSNDAQVNKIANQLLNCNTNPKDKCGDSKTIGLRRLVKLIPSTSNEGTINKIILFEYNYLQSKKFKYLRNDALTYSEILVFIINIYDKRGLENLKSTFEEISQKFSNNSSVITSNSNNVNFIINTCSINKKLCFILLKNTNNFLLKLLEKQTLAAVKLEISQLTQSSSGMKFIEIEDDISSQVKNILFEIMK